MHETAPDFNHNQPVYAVSEVAFAIKRTVEERFGHVRLRGEISGWRGAASSGHAYFRLKDDKAVLDAVCWRGTLSKIPCKLEEGLEVICTGKITTYPGKSNYQIVIDSIEPAGIGALMALLEKRRKALEAEGLFAPERKRQLPFMPRCIGVVTSPTGAVIRDILHRISERFPLHVLVWPVAVQGEGAAEKIAEAINGFNNLPPVLASCSPHEAGSGLAPSAEGACRPDVLIVARGGGSIEDLWAFNEEIVVRAAANSRIPLISAVGHETDTTLIDYVSDKRAPTPTAAAEMATPVREELWLYCKQLDARLATCAQQSLSRRQDMLAALLRGLPRPRELLQTATQRLDDWAERLQSAPRMHIERHAQGLASVAGRLRPQTLLADMERSQKRMAELYERMGACMQRGIERREDALSRYSALLSSLDYRRVLARGYALVKNAEGHVISSASEASRQEKLQIIFQDGGISVLPPVK